MSCFTCRLDVWFPKANPPSGRGTPGSRGPLRRSPRDGRHGSSRGATVHHVVPRASKVGLESTLCRPRSAGRAVCQVARPDTFDRPDTILDTILRDTILGHPRCGQRTRRHRFRQTAYRSQEGARAGRISSRARRYRRCESPSWAPATERRLAVFCRPAYWGAGRPKPRSQWVETSTHRVVGFVDYFLPFFLPGLPGVPPFSSFELAGSP